MLWWWASVRISLQGCSSLQVLSLTVDSKRQGLKGKERDLGSSLAQGPFTENLHCAVSWLALLPIKLIKPYKPGTGCKTGSLDLEISLEISRFTSPVPLD